MPKKIQKTRKAAPSKPITRRAAPSKPITRRAKPAAPAARPFDAVDREGWLNEAAIHLREFVRVTMSDLGIACRHRPPPLISVGYPSGRRGAGQCWVEVADRATIYLNPQIGADATGTAHLLMPAKATSDYAPSLRILDVLLHAIIHDEVGEQCGHRDDFADVARRCGLVGSLRDSYASPGLLQRLDVIRAKLGCDYPHVVSTQERSQGMPGQRHQSSRQRKFVCSRCQRIIRCAGGEPDALHFCEGMPRNYSQMIKMIEARKVGRFIEPKIGPDRLKE